MIEIDFFLPPANEICEGNVFTGVCLSMGGGVSQHALGRGVCIPACTGQEGCVSKDALGGVCPAWGGVCGRHPLVNTMGYSQQAGGTHPTEMHSCNLLYFLNKYTKALYLIS